MKLTIPQVAQLLQMVGDKQWLKPYVHAPTAQIIPLAPQGYRLQKSDAQHYDMLVPTQPGMPMLPNIPPYNGK